MVRHVLGFSGKKSAVMRHMPTASRDGHTAGRVAPEQTCFGCATREEARPYLVARKPLSVPVISN